MWVVNCYCSFDAACQSGVSYSYTIGEHGSKIQRRRTIRTTRVVLYEGLTQHTTATVETSGAVRYFITLGNDSIHSMEKRKHVKGKLIG